ncbi:MAG: type II toxin-antitoxin system RelE/ParE family toxin [Campylobacterota bacterium]|nr:type II toxin-antitoxin system RelE/ParE family toxin [Campylobacterota bacterium]
MYSIEYHEDIKKDFKELGHSSTLLVLKKITQIAKNPIIGNELGNRANLNLVGCRKVYVDNKRVRIVYKVIESKIKVFVVAVGKRDDMAVYKKASQRV